MWCIYNQGRLLCARRRTRRGARISEETKPLRHKNATSRRDGAEDEASEGASEGKVSVFGEERPHREGDTYGEPCGRGEREPGRPPVGEEHSRQREHVVQRGPWGGGVPGESAERGGWLCWGGWERGVAMDKAKGVQVCRVFVLACWGCLNKVPGAERLKRWNVLEATSSQSGRQRCHALSGDSREGGS